MSEAFGSDYLTIEDEEGNEFELEILNEFELDGQDYLAATARRNKFPRGA